MFILSRSVSKYFQIRKIHSRFSNANVKRLFKIKFCTRYNSNRFKYIIVSQRFNNNYESVCFNLVFLFHIIYYYFDNNITAYSIATTTTIINIAAVRVIVSQLTTVSLYTSINYYIVDNNVLVLYRKSITHRRVSNIIQVEGLLMANIIRSALYI